VGLYRLFSAVRCSRIVRAADTLPRKRQGVDVGGVGEGSSYLPCLTIDGLTVTSKSNDLELSG
jgi:hypothetical protein